MVAVPDMAGLPFCPENGLWRTAWCLVAMTGSVARDCAVFAAEQIMPQSAWATLEPLWRMLCLLPPITAVGGWMDMAGAKLWKATSDAFTLAAPSTSKRIAAELEAQRTAFTNRFPQHVSLLPAGELVNLVGTIAWLALFFMLIWHLANCCWGRRLQAPEVFFFPDRSGRHVARLCSEIRAARRRIWLAMYMLTDSELCEVIVQAYQRGVDVRVIVDDENAETYGAQAQLLNAGVPLVSNKSWARMHHKFMVLDRRVFSGSFNWTRQASRANRENLWQLVDPVFVQAFAGEFTRLWGEFHGAGHKRCDYAATTKPGSSGRRRDGTPPPSRGARDPQIRTAGDLRRNGWVPTGYGGD
mmetsp:Transcript_98139/g.189515  ORF Transcript_98139/g.189515 Transcript_98139/m.189515 type:complete len:356 (-) Transcript_98139:184-1251(-)